MRVALLNTYDWGGAGTATGRIHRGLRIVEVIHGIVGEAVDLADSSGAAAAVAPAELPDCDLLVLDCEGAEIGILELLEQNPRVLIIETHAFLNSPEEDVRAALDDMDYDVVGRGVEVEELGVYLFTAVERS